MEYVSIGKEVWGSVMGTKHFGRVHDEVFCDWHFTISIQAQDVCIQFQSTHL